MKARKLLVPVVFGLLVGTASASSFIAEGDVWFATPEEVAAMSIKSDVVGSERVNYSIAPGSVNVDPLVAEGDVWFATPEETAYLEHRERVNFSLSPDASAAIDFWDGPEYD